MTIIRRTTDQIIAEARSEAHSYSHNRLRTEIMSWIDTMMNSRNIPDYELEKIGQIIKIYYLAGQRKGTNFGKMPQFYQMNLVGIIAGMGI